jgi:hypothetical protein
MYDNLMTSTNDDFVIRDGKFSNV